MPTSAELLQRAREAQTKAYAPYSKYKVGAAILTASGEIFTGANVENMSFGATICAERSAIIAMVMAGHREIIAVAIVTPDGGYPCGICLQSLREFIIAPDECKIVVPLENGLVEKTFRELAPNLWSSPLV